jgi:hypothetical protein
MGKFHGSCWLIFQVILKERKSMKYLRYVAHQMKVIGLELDRYLILLS